MPGWDELSWVNTTLITPDWHHDSHFWHDNSSHIYTCVYMVLQDDEEKEEDYDEEKVDDVDEED